jgi:putative copper export protein
MNLYHSLEKLEASAFAQFIRESTWLFPAIEATHLLALAFLGGSLLIVVLTVLGVGLPRPPAELLRTSRPFVTGAIIMLLITGVLLGVSEPLKLYDRRAFLVKMIALAVSLIVTYRVFNPRIERGEEDGMTRSVAGLTIALWLAVAIAGRWIGFS